MKNCIFCDLPKEKIIIENELARAFYDEFPVSKGHILIIPKRHIANFFELEQKELNDINSLILECKKIIDNKYSPDGYNIGVNVGEHAGQSVFHVHVHLIPRYKGDVANPKGGVRGVIPEKQNY